MKEKHWPIRIAVDGALGDTNARQIIEAGADIVREKSAIVFWKLPTTYVEAMKKIYLYAKGDAKSGIWWHPVKKFSTHNIKILFIYFRYLVALYLVFLSFFITSLDFPIILGCVFYIFWAFRKVYIETSDWKAGLFGILLQFSSDAAVMAGFFIGLVVK